jgi:hypothetical protein
MAMEVIREKLLPDYIAKGPDIIVVPAASRYSAAIQLDKYRTKD